MAMKNIGHDCASWVESTVECLWPRILLLTYDEKNDVETSLKWVHLLQARTRDARDWMTPRH